MGVLKTEDDVFNNMTNTRCVAPTSTTQTTISRWPCLAGSASRHVTVTNHTHTHTHTKLVSADMEYNLVYSCFTITNNPPPQKISFFPKIYLFIYLFNYLFNYSIIYSIIDSFNYSFIHLFIYLFIHSFIYSFIYSIIYLFIYLYICSFLFLRTHSIHC